MKRGAKSTDAAAAVTSATTADEKLTMKARKSAIEAQGMHSAHVRDGAALCSFLAFMEDQVSDGGWINAVFLI